MTGHADDPATLLLVEDDPVIRTFLADNLTADGYELLVAGTIEEALRELEYKRPDLAVVDLKLPDGSGLELIRRVRAADGVGSRLDPTMPLVVLSGCGRRARSHPRASSMGSTTTSPSRSPIRSCDCGSRPCCGARGRACTAGCCAWGSSRSTRRRARRRCAGAASSSRRRSSRCCGRSPRRRRACSRRRSCCATSGASGRSAHTRTLDSHACRLRQKLRVQGDQFIVNVWGVGYRLVDGPAHSCDL